MAAIPPDLVERLESRPRPAFDRAAAEARYLADLVAGLPDWTPSKDELLRRSLALVAETNFFQWSLMLAKHDASNVLRATGDDLEEIGVGRFTPRRAGEQDADYRLRIMNATGRLVPVTLPDYLEFVPAFQSDIEDIQAVRNPANRDEVWVYALKAANADLSSDEMTAITNHFSLEANKMANLVGVVAKAVNKQAFTIAANIRIPPDAASDTIEELARQALYGYIDELRIGDGIWVEKLGGVVNVLPDVVYATVTATQTVGYVDASTNLDPFYGTLYTCAKSGADVVITVTVV